MARKQSEATGLFVCHERDGISDEFGAPFLLYRFMAEMQRRHSRLFLHRTLAYMRPTVYYRRTRPPRIRTLQKIYENIENSFVPDHNSYNALICGATSVVPQNDLATITKDGNEVTGEWMKFSFVAFHQNCHKDVIVEPATVELFLLKCHNVRSNGRAKKKKPIASKIEEVLLGRCVVSVNAMEKERPSSVIYVNSALFHLDNGFSSGSQAIKLQVCVPNSGDAPADSPSPRGSVTTSRRLRKRPSSEISDHHNSVSDPSLAKTSTAFNRFRAGRSDSNANSVNFITPPCSPLSHASTSSFHSALNGSSAQGGESQELTPSSKRRRVSRGNTLAKHGDVPATKGSLEFAPGDCELSTDEEKKCGISITTNTMVYNVVWPINTEDLTEGQYEMCLRQCDEFGKTAGQPTVQSAEETWASDPRHASINSLYDEKIKVEQGLDTNCILFRLSKTSSNQDDVCPSLVAKESKANCTAFSCQDSNKRHTCPSSEGVSRMGRGSIPTGGKLNIPLSASCAKTKLSPTSSNASSRATQRSGAGCRVRFGLGPFPEEVYFKFISDLPDVQCTSSTTISDNSLSHDACSAEGNVSQSNSAALGLGSESLKTYGKSLNSTDGGVKSEDKTEAVCDVRETRSAKRLTSIKDIKDMIGPNLEPCGMHLSNAPAVSSSPVKPVKSTSKRKHRKSEKSGDHSTAVPSPSLKSKSVDSLPKEPISAPSDPQTHDVPTALPVQQAQQIIRIHSGDKRVRFTTKLRQHRCPMCSVWLGCLYSLLKHWQMCHARLLIQYEPSPDQSKAMVVVQLNPQYDGTYEGCPSRVYAPHSPLKTFTRRRHEVRRPRKGQISFQILWIASRKSRRHFLNHKCDLNEFTGTFRTQNLPKRVLCGHKRQYFHANTCLPRRPDDMDTASEDESAPGWLHTRSDKMIDDFTDVNGGEKLLMKMWNRHMLLNSNKFLADCQMSQSVSSFISQFGSEIIAGGIRRNFLLHLAALHRCGLISPEDVHDFHQALFVQKVMGARSCIPRGLAQPSLQPTGADRGCFFSASTCNVDGDGEGATLLDGGLLQTNLARPAASSATSINGVWGESHAGTTDAASCDSSLEAWFQTARAGKSVSLQSIEDIGLLDSKAISLDNPPTNIRSNKPHSLRSESMASPTNFRHKHIKVIVPVDNNELIDSAGMDEENSGRTLRCQTHSSLGKRSGDTSASLVTAALDNSTPPKNLATASTHRLKFDLTMDCRLYTSSENDDDEEEGVTGSGESGSAGDIEISVKIPTCGARNRRIHSRSNSSTCCGGGNGEDFSDELPSVAGSPNHDPVEVRNESRRSSGAHHNPVLTNPSGVIRSVGIPAVLQESASWSSPQTHFNYICANSTTSMSNNNNFAGDLGASHTSQSSSSSSSTFLEMSPSLTLRSSRSSEKTWDSSSPFIVNSCGSISHRSPTSDLMVGQSYASTNRKPSGCEALNGGLAGPHHVRQELYRFKDLGPSSPIKRAIPGGSIVGGVPVLPSLDQELVVPQLLMRDRLANQRPIADADEASRLAGWLNAAKSAFS